MDTIDDALRVIASLNQEGVDYVVVGGVALNLHGLVRATEDLELCSAGVRKYCSPAPSSEGHLA